MMKFSTVLAGAVVAALALVVGCELSNSPNNTVRNVAVDFSGFYDNDGAPLSSSQSGDPVTSFNLRQTGDRLEAVDNNGIIFKGTLGEVSGESGSASSIFELNGRTTANGDVTISGTISGSDNQGTMSGTWIEPDRFGNFYAQGTISTINTNSNGGGGTNNNSAVSINPSSATLTVNGETDSFTASGGSGSYAWQISNSNGTLNNTSGGSVTYTRTSSGNNTITVRDSNDSGKTASATITQP
ncbi:MAG: hypothetical protein V1929_12995 [bacterium]